MQDQVWILYDWYYGKAPRYRDYVSPSMGRFVEGHWYDRGRKNKAGEQRKVYAFMNTTEKEDWVVVRLEQLLVPKLPGPHDVEGAALDVVKEQTQPSKISTKSCASTASVFWVGMSYGI